MHCLNLVDRLLCMLLFRPPSQFSKTDLSNNFVCRMQCPLCILKMYKMYTLMYVLLNSVYGFYFSFIPSYRYFTHCFSIGRLTGYEWNTEIEIKNKTTRQTHTHTSYTLHWQQSSSNSIWIVNEIQKIFCFDQSSLNAQFHLFIHWGND